MSLRLSQSQYLPLSFPLGETLANFLVFPDVEISSQGSPLPGPIYHPTSARVLDATKAHHFDRRLGCGPLALFAFGQNFLLLRGT